MGTTRNLEFEECLDKGKIRRFSAGRSLAKKEMVTAKSDLDWGLDSLRRGNYKWTVVQSYYSMFHSARALIYALGYREKSHYCLIVALRVLYVDKGKLDFELVEAFSKAKVLREDADYYDNWSREGAEFMLTKAKRFLLLTKKILINKS